MNLNTNTIKINLNGFEELLSTIEKSVYTNNKIIINYINFYSFNLAISNITFRNILNSFDYNFPDGIGIWLGLRLFKADNFFRFNLTDYGFEFMKECELRKWKLFFLGSHNVILSKAKLKLIERFPNLNITGMMDGYESLSNIDLTKTINKYNPDILLVGLGSLKQEKWIFENQHLINSKVILSVGDLFSNYSGEKYRGGKIIQSLGLEWMIRLIHSPFKYSKRYMGGIPKYIYNLIRYKFNMKNPFSTAT